MHDEQTDRSATDPDDGGERYEPPTVRSLGGVHGVTQQTAPGIPGG